MEFTDDAFLDMLEDFSVFVEELLNGKKEASQPNQEKKDSTCGSHCTCSGKCANKYADPVSVTANVKMEKNAVDKLTKSTVSTDDFEDMVKSTNESVSPKNFASDETESKEANTSADRKVSIGTDPELVEHFNADQITVYDVTKMIMYLAAERHCVDLLDNEWAKNTYFEAGLSYFEDEIADLIDAIGESTDEAYTQILALKAMFEKMMN